MDLNTISHVDIMACFFAILGGLIRLMLNVDKLIPVWKQIIFLFISAMPCGYLSYRIATDYGFEKAAYPLSFVVGIMALSIVTKIAKDGTIKLFDFIDKKNK